MGRDKALLTIDGRSFVERIVEAARPVSNAMTIVGRNEPIAGTEAIDDLRPGLGPLAGIETALDVCRTSHALIIACDLPFVTTEFLQFLVARSHKNPEAAIVPLDGDGRVSPLCAIYPASAQALASELLDRGERMPRSLLMQIPADLVAASEFAHLSSSGLFLSNVNTPEDLADAERVAAVNRPA